MATKAELEKENKKLMTKVKKLEKQVERLEDLIEEKHDGNEPRFSDFNEYLKYCSHG